MPPPWVVFDRVPPFGDCSNGAEPDIAGIGVVLSFVLASIMTTIASILAMFLDQVFDARGQFRIRRPIKSLREKFRNAEGKINNAWRPFLDPLIIGFGDQQLITGYAVLLSGWIKVAQNSFELYSAHFVMILYICALSSSSHLAALITLRKYFHKYRLIAKIRMTMVVLFAFFLLCSMIASLAVPLPIALYEDHFGTQQRAHRLALLVPMFLMLLGFSTALTCVLYHPKTSSIARQTSDLTGRSMVSLVHRLADPKHANFPRDLRLRIFCFLFLNPLMAFIMQIILMLLSMILVLSQKFAVPQDREHWCGLNGPDENAWGFGQTLSVVMLLLPAMSTAQTYLEGRHEIKEGD